MSLSAVFLQERVRSAKAEMFVANRGTNPVGAK